MTPIALDRFRERFLPALHGRIQKLDDLVAGASSGASEPLEALVLAFHSLSGIGGTYGYPAVSRVASAAEDAARLLIESDPRDREGLLRSLQDSIGELRKLAREAGTAKSLS